MDFSSRVDTRHRSGLMLPFLILFFREDFSEQDFPWAHPCLADNENNAVIQCEQVYPGCRIVHVCQTESLLEALDDYNYGERNKQNNVRNNRKWYHLRSEEDKII